MISPNAPRMNSAGRRHRCLLVLVSLSFACASHLFAQSEAPLSAVYERQPLAHAFPDASQALDTAVADGDAAGVVHLVGEAGDVVLTGQFAELGYQHASGVADVDSGAALGPNSLVRIYSMTKPITSVTAMTLFDQGEFQLDDPVAKFLPAFNQSTVWDAKAEQAIPPKRPITVRDVFCHATGYAYGGNGNARLNERYVDAGLQYRPPASMLPPDMTIAEAANRLAAIPAHHHPGERFTYGYSTDLLGRLVEVWSGQNLDEYMDAAVLGPLEMNDTGFDVPEEKRNRFASCHTTLNGELVVIDAADQSPFLDGFEFLSGGGGLISTANDYAKFCAMLVNGGQWKGKRILQEATLELMFTNQLTETPGDFQFGLGFAIDEITVAGHTAKQYSWAGYASTTFAVVPELNLFQVNIRQHVPSKHGLGRKVAGMIYERWDPAKE